MIFNGVLKFVTHLNLIRNLSNTVYVFSWLPLSNMFNVITYYFWILLL